MTQRQEPTPAKPRLAISFSGGRTSAVMTKLLTEKYRETHDICVTFANTGQEHEATLEFVKECDQRFNFNVVWLEAEVDMTPGVGVRHRVVTFETASRDGRPFRDYIAKYGIPNMGSPKCTGILKEDTIHNYIRSQKWAKGSYDTAIGIRADEASRMSSRMVESRFIYPLVDLGYTKEKVIQEVRSWGFDLQLPGEHYGNCTWCWKKSLRKLLTVAKNSPEHFDFPLQMEAEFSKHKVTPATASPCGHRLFFRGHRSTQDILAQSKQPFEEFTDKYQIREDDALDYGVGCGESCEIGSDERFGSKIDMDPDYVEGEWI